MKFSIHKYLIFPYKIGNEVYISLFGTGKIVRFGVDVFGELIIGVAHSTENEFIYYHKHQLDEIMYYYT